MSVSWLCCFGRADWSLKDVSCKFTMCLVRQLRLCCFGRADWSLKDLSCKTM